MSINLSNVAILNIKGSDYRCVISLISKNEAINLLQNADWPRKVEHYKKSENYKLKKIWKILEAYTNIIKLLILKSQNQHKGPISIKNLDINKTVISNNISFGKKGFNYFINYNFDWICF